MQSESEETNDGDDDLDNEPRAAATRRISLLSLESEGEDADAEPSEEEDVDDALRDAGDGGGGGEVLEYGAPSSVLGVAAAAPASMPGTPARGGPAEWHKEYSSETEARRAGRRRHHQRRRRRARERWLERAWQMKKSHAAEEVDSAAGAAAECRVLLRPRCGSGRMRMDMDEVRACRDLGLGLPTEWTVEIPETFSDLTADTSSGGNSPVHWRISSPGDDPKDVKARLKVWAQAVALTSASRLSGC